MKLVASMMVGPGEANRYLEPVVTHLRTFCDEVVCRVEGEDEWNALMTLPVVAVNAVARFYDHEGVARQELLDFTLRQSPTHVLAVDADEFVEDGHRLRELLQHDADVWSLHMAEIWEACDDRLCERTDGAWATGAAQVWRVPPNPSGLRMADRALASGRIPEDIARTVGGHRVLHTGIAMLHFGWANPHERQARYQRYVEHDGGEFHASTHLDSITWPSSRINLKARPWPDALSKLTILDRANRP